MPNAALAAFASWTIPPWATLFLVLTAWVYLRGWRRIRLTRPRQFPSWRLACFLAGLATIWIAIASPLDSLSGMLLVVHMTQHLLLMSVAPPLVALSAPLVPLLRGLPRFWVREGLGPFFSLAPVHALERLLKSRLFAWLAMNLAFIAWHVPGAYDLALAHPALHEAEHACFFLTSLLFWWPVIEPWPVVYKGSRWWMLPYLMSADIVNTALSALLSFSGRVVYPAYAAAPRLLGISPSADQVAAGSLMWVLGSTAFLPPIMWITHSMLSRRGQRREAARAASAPGPARVSSQTEGGPTPGRALGPLGRSTGDPFGGSLADPRPSSMSAAPSQRERARFDLFTLPAVGAFFKSRYGRQSLQAILLLVSAALMVDGFFGHRMGSMNLASIVAWTYARALFVLALLLVGNLFCMSCPFMLPRELAKKLARAAGFARLPWPRRLRGKWLSATLLGLFFWAYEAFALWDSPLRTASLLAAYFLTALTLDSIFRGASFCKYVCPLGQFNFVSSLLSPVELEARSLSTCGSCSTRDCIAGAKQDGRQTQRGCELDLFMPQKSGNLDCTLCMDCVKACPHDNIGLFVRAPRDLVQIAEWDPPRSSVGRYSRRPDLAALALIIVAAAFASAAVMVAPVAAILERLASALPGWLTPAAGLAVAVSAPAVLFALVSAAVLLLRRRLHSPATHSLLTDDPATDLRGQLCSWTLALLPLGLSMWAAHLCWHLFTAWYSLVPGLLQAFGDLQSRLPGLSSLVPMPALRAPEWVSAPGLLSSDGMLEVQLYVLDAGLLFTLYMGWRRVRAPAPAPGSHNQSPSSASGMDEYRDRVTPSMPIAESLLTLAPWAALVLLLYAAGVWVLLEPMQMRGMMGM